MHVEGLHIEGWQVAVTDEEIDLLRAALRRTRWPRQVEDAGWREGTDLAYLQELVAYWADEFDWRAVEARLNEEPQFLARVGAGGETSGRAGEPLDVHFVHRRGVGPAPLPLVLTHGWPSTYFEFHDVIGPLADPGAHGGDPADAFDVIVPSLPGYGFSSVPSRVGTGPSRIAALWDELVRGLGYQRYGAAGCDWGALVTSLMGLDHPEHLVGIHLGMLTLRARARDEAASAADLEEERAFAARSKAWARTEAAYTDIQGTKPQSLAYGLNDSPVGLAAWIVEKFRAWGDTNGDVESVFTRDDLLTNLSIYWFTQTIGSANRLYHEARRNPRRLAEGERVTVPTGFLLERALPEGHVTPNIGLPPRRRAELAYDVRRWTIAPRGAHFPAWETPDLYVDEVRAFFRDLRPHH